MIIKHFCNSSFEGSYDYEELTKGKSLSIGKIFTTTDDTEYMVLNIMISDANTVIVESKKLYKLSPRTEKSYYACYESDYVKYAKYFSTKEDAMKQAEWAKGVDFKNARVLTRQEFMEEFHPTHNTVEYEKIIVRGEDFEFFMLTEKEKQELSKSAEKLVDEIIENVSKSKDCELCMSEPATTQKDHDDIMYDVCKNCKYKIESGHFD